MNASDFEWYHEINLGDEITKPVSNYRDNWEMVRRVRKKIDYRGKSVLDIAAWDGMWSFEAESLGAKSVTAVDVIPRTSGRRDIAEAPAKFLFAREKLHSKVVPYFDRSIHRLRDILPLTGKFDIIQNLGLLYHLENPWHAIKECRHMMNPGGRMLLETAFDYTTPGASMRLNRGTSTFYGSDVTSYWAPTIECLLEMLAACHFLPDEKSIEVLGHRHSSADRICLVAIASEIPSSSDFNCDFRTGL